VRINTIICPIAEAIRQFVEEGWQQVIISETCDYTQFIAQVKNLKDDEFMIDFHLSFLLVFPSKTQFHQHFLLHNGSILLQDKVLILLYCYKTIPFISAHLKQ